MLFLQTLIDALTLGALYALIALGYTMVYGVLGFINFAHSDVFAIGAWTAVLTAGVLGLGSAIEPTGWPVLVILPASMLVCATLALLIQWLAYRPLRNAPRLNVLITAIGVSLLLQGVGQLPQVLGTEPRQMPQVIQNPVLFQHGDLQITAISVAIVLLALGLMLALEMLIFRTKFGTAMRAVAHSPQTASLMGINVNRVIDGTFILGGALAGAGSVLFAMRYTGIQEPASQTWVLLGLKAFIAAVVGGIGNVRGAMVGAFLIALLEQFGAAAYGLVPAIGFDTTQYKEAYCFAVLILVLLIRPTGIFGSTAVEKV